MLPTQTSGGSAGYLDVTAPATDDARRWSGWGTALKPARELEIAIRDGRTFEASDRLGEGEIPIVINEELAKRYFPGENPIGRLVGGVRVTTAPA